MIEGPAAELLWFVVGLVLLISELALPGFVIIFFGIGAWLTALGVAVGLTETFFSQLVFFLVSSLASLVIFRKRGKSYFEGKVSARLGPDESMDDFKGARAVVTRAIHPSRTDGAVELHGTTWMARAEEPIAAGTVVEVLERMNLTLRVKPIP